MEKKLERNPQNKMLAGVASGLADYLLIDVTIVRILFILLVIFGFSGIIIYLALWIAVPEVPMSRQYPYSQSFRDDEIPDLRQKTQVSVTNKTDKGRLVAGLLLISVGCWFMLAELDVIPDWLSIFKLWPVVLIVIGLIMLFRSGVSKKTYLDTKEPFDMKEPFDFDSSADKNNRQKNANDLPLS